MVKPGQIQPLNTSGIAAKGDGVSKVRDSPLSVTPRTRRLVDVGKDVASRTLVVPRLFSRANSERVGQIANRAAALANTEKGVDSDLDHDASGTKGKPNLPKQRSSQKKSQPFLINVDSPFVIVWDVVLLIFIVYITFLTPLSVALDLGDLDVENPWTVLATIDFIIDIVFIVDVVINFFSAYIDENGVEVTDQKEIRDKYLKSWFTVDFLSSIPFSVFQITAIYVQQAELADLSLDSASETASFLRVSRIIRFVKVTRLVKCVRIITKNSSIEISKNQRRLLRDLGILFLLLHFVACTYITVAYMGGIEESLHDSWVGNCLPEVRSLSGADLNVQLYVTALYWAVATLTTVGFGDVVPVNTAERVVAIVAMLVSAAYYGYLIASMASGVSAWDADAARTNERMEQLVAYTKAKRFPHKLRTKIKNYYQEYYKEKATVNELEVLRGLSVGLRREVTDFMLDDAKGELLSNMLLFKQLDRTVLAKLLLALTPQHFSAGDKIMEAGRAERSLFILLSGDVQIDTPFFERRPTTSLKVGSSFGEMQFLGLRPTGVLTLTAKSACKLWAISRKDFFEMLDETDDTLSRIVSTAMAIYQQYFDAFADDPELKIDSRLSKYIAEVARFDVVEENRFFDAEQRVAAAAEDEGDAGAVHAVTQFSSSPTQENRKSLRQAQEQSPARESKEHGLPAGATLEFVSHEISGPIDDSQIVTPEMDAMERKGLHRRQAHMSYSLRRHGSNDSIGGDSYDDGSDDSTSLVAWIDEFKLTVEARLEALNSALDSLGAPPAESQQIVSVQPAFESHV
eukprot:INCI19887.1.p1 GENE.INCI19887.1~~INCI19887.1.p1  ORF type:complete len:801 (-),score=137.43 INCI19887.1:297-2699(-)